MEVPHGSLRQRFLIDRALTATTLLGAKDRRLDEVALALGYGSGRALALALCQLGMGRPSDIRRQAREAAPHGCWMTPGRQLGDFM